MQDSKSPKLPISNNGKLYRPDLLAIDLQKLVRRRKQFDRVSVTVVFDSIWLMIDKGDI
jgi:hypothetical protein